MNTESAKSIANKESILENLLSQLTLEINESDLSLNHLEGKLHRIHNTEHPANPTPDSGEPIRNDVVTSLEVLCARLRNVRYRISEVNSKLNNLI